MRVMLTFGMLLVAGSPSAARDEHGAASTPEAACADDNGGITLPAGFCATVFADDVGHATPWSSSPGESQPRLLDHLLLNPPDRALVLCADEKSQIQAVDREQRSSQASSSKPRPRTKSFDRWRNFVPEFLTQDTRTPQV
jgi:hypothetical protein